MRDTSGQSRGHGVFTFFADMPPPRRVATSFFNFTNCAIGVQSGNISTNVYDVVVVDNAEEKVVVTCTKTGDRATTLYTGRADDALKLTDDVDSVVVELKPLHGAAHGTRPVLQVVVAGRARRVKTVCGDATVHGDVEGTAETMSGNVSVDGTVRGAATTMSGNVCVDGNVRGRATTMSGTVRRHRSHGRLTSGPANAKREHEREPPHADTTPCTDWHLQVRTFNERGVCIKTETRPLYADAPVWFNGDVHDVSTVLANVVVHGTAKNVETRSGCVHVASDAHGNVSSMSGNVDVHGNVVGDATTMSGNVQVGSTAPA